jgi:hypothetical protein
MAKLVPCIAQECPARFTYMFRSRLEQMWGSRFTVHGSPFVLVLVVVLVLDWSYEGVTSGWANRQPSRRATDGTYRTHRPYRSRTPNAKR